MKAVCETPDVAAPASPSVRRGQIRENLAASRARSRIGAGIEAPICCVRFPDFCWIRFIFRNSCYRTDSHDNLRTLPLLHLECRPPAAMVATKRTCGGRTPCVESVCVTPGFAPEIDTRMPALSAFRSAPSMTFAAVESRNGTAEKSKMKLLRLSQGRLCHSIQANNM